MADIGSKKGTQYLVVLDPPTLDERQSERGEAADPGTIDVILPHTHSDGKFLKLKPLDPPDSEAQTRDGKYVDPEHPGRVEVVKDRVYWDPLGSGLICQIRGCKSPAYKTCDKQWVGYACSSFKGCGKRACMRHIKIIMNKKRSCRKENIDIGVEIWRCRTSECKEVLEKAIETTTNRYTLLFVGIMAFIIFLISMKVRAQ